MRALRRWVASLNTAVTVGLLGLLFIMGNYLASRHYGRWDLSRQQLATVSSQTVHTLQSLQEPVHVVVFYQPGHRLYDLVTSLLDEYTRLTPKLTVERIDPQQDRARAVQLVKQLQIEDLNVVVFQAGTRHKYVSDTDLAEYDYANTTITGEPRVKAFKGEEAFTSAILGLTRAAATRLWVTSGHGEKSLDASEPDGLSSLKKYLEQQNIAIETVPLLERKAIPDDTALVLIPGPTHRFTDGEAALLQAYLDRGGRLLLLTDPLTETGLEGLLGQWGVTLGNDIVIDPARQLPFVSAANLLVTTYTRHPIVNKMQTLMTLFPMARSVRPAAPPPAGLAVTPLALTSEKGWGETQTGTETFAFTEGQDLKGPVPIAVAVERRKTATEPGRDGAPARLVVIGDSDFATNAQLGSVGNRDFAISAIYWLMEQERLIGIGPKTVESLRLHLTGAQLRSAFWVCVAGLPLLLGTLGLGVWWLRRR